MPNRDGTGPEGKGPKTGRGQGRCGGVQTNANRPRDGRGRGQGRGLERNENNN